MGWQNQLAMDPKWEYHQLTMRKWGYIHNDTAGYNWAVYYKASTKMECSQPATSNNRGRNWHKCKYVWLRIWSCRMMIIKMQPWFSLDLKQLVQARSVNPEYKAWVAWKCILHRPPMDALHRVMHKIKRGQQSWGKQRIHNYTKMFWVNASLHTLANISFLFSYLHHYLHVPRNAMMFYTWMLSTSRSYGGFSK